MNPTWEVAFIQVAKSQVDHIWGPLRHEEMSVHHAGFRFIRELKKELKG
jgi:hypothetical protein